MQTNLMHLIENKDLALDRQNAYAAILGLTPSRGARSPILWNAAFKGLGIPAKMVPMDVREENLSALVELLKKDTHFLGGAVTMPFKTQILPLLDSIEPEAKAAGAVNCFYKKDGAMIGTNTDGLAAASTLKAFYSKDLRGAKVLLAGLGGAGSAVAAYVGKEIGKTGLLALANRSKAALGAAMSRIESFCQTKALSSWPVPADTEPFDIIINATSLGFEPPREDKNGWFMPKYFTPFGSGPDSVRCGSKTEAESRYLQNAASEVSKNITESILFLEKQRNAFVDDIIYQPKETLLLSLAKMCGCRTQNGLAMNLEQAVIAFDKTTAASAMRSSGPTEVRRLMEAGI